MPSGDVGVVGVGVVGVVAMSISGWLCGDSKHIGQVTSGGQSPRGQGRRFPLRQQRFRGDWRETV